MCFLARKLQALRRKQLGLWCVHGGQPHLRPVRFPLSLWCLCPRELLSAASVAVWEWGSGSGHQHDLLTFRSYSYYFEFSHRGFGFEHRDIHSSNEFQCIGEWPGFGKRPTLGGFKPHLLAGHQPEIGAASSTREQPGRPEDVTGGYLWSTIHHPSAQNHRSTSCWTGLRAAGLVHLANVFLRGRKCTVPFFPRLCCLSS